MADIFLIIVTVVAFVILLVIGVYLLVHYQHPDDHNAAYFPKAIVVLGFVLAGGTVLMLPLDVANNEGYAGCAGFDTALCGGMNMDALWSGVFWLVPVWVFLLIPFTTFYYEADDGMLMAGTAYYPNAVKKSRFVQAACYQVIVIIIVAIIFAVLYVGLGSTNVSAQSYLQGEGIGLILPSSAEFFTIEIKTNASNTSALLPFSTSLLADMGATDAAWMTKVQKAGVETIALRTTLATFYGGFMAWLGWLLLCIFGGIGLTALPLDLILAYVHRPQHMDATEFAEAQVSLRERVNELVEVGELIKVEREEKAQSGLSSSWGTWSLDKDTRAAAQDERQAYLGFKQAVFLLEQDVEDFQAVASNYENYNPIMPYACLFFGVISAIISFFWFVHIIVYVLPDPPIVLFLNQYFSWFDAWFPMLGTINVAIFTSYLLLCAIKGCFKFGVRFMFFQIHPMKIGKTYMSSFLFNIGLVLLCSLAVVQFCQDAFANYAANATIRQLFGVQVQNLKFFGLFWTGNIFVYIFMVMNVLTGMYLACKPKDQGANAQALRDRLRSRTASGRADGGEPGGGGVAASSTSVAAAPQSVDL